MGWNFRKRVKVAPGVKVNVSKSGVSTTVGTKGASVNIGKKGVFGNVGLPGTGIYRREKLSGGSGVMKDEEPVQLGFIGTAIAASVVSAIVGFLIGLGTNSKAGCISALVVFCLVIVLRSISASDTEQEPEHIKEPTTKPKEIANPSSPKKWSKKQKIRSVRK